jgi:hypothetical protein
MTPVMALVAPSTRQVAAASMRSPLEASSFDAPIMARGDGQVATAASSGTGTPEDPFVIENLHIMASSSVIDYIWISFLGIRKYWFSPGISLHDLSVSVLIRNVIVEVPLDSLGSFRAAGFTVDNCVDVDFENVQTLGPFETAFYIRGDYNDPVNPIFKGDFTVTDFSVEGFLTEQDGGIVTNFVNSFVLETGVVGNAFNYGLRRGTTIYTSLNFRMHQVAFDSCAFFIDMPVNLAGVDIDDTNTVDGKPILFFNGASGFTVGAVDNPAQVVAIGCSDFEVANLVIDSPGFQLLLYNCLRGWIHGVEITNSLYDAVFMVACGGMLIEGCDIHYNLRGGILSGLGNPLYTNVIRNNCIYNNGRNVRPLLSSNMEIANNEIYYTEDLIDLYLPQAPDVVLYGIQMMGSNDMNIHDNHIYNVNYAIDQEYFYGIGTANNVRISGNVMDLGYLANYDMSYWSYGIGSSIPATNWTVSGNVFQGFDIPLAMMQDDSSITGNTFVGGSIQVSGIGTAVFGNNFLGCTAGGYDVVWDNGNGMGNYWSDYSIKYPDATNNGIFWDTPYNCEGALDSFPLVNPYNGDPALPQIAAILISLESLEQHVMDVLDGGRENACLNQLESIFDSMEDLVVASNAGEPVNQHTVHKIGTKLHAIQAISKDETIYNECIAIQALVDAL